MKTTKADEVIKNKKRIIISSCLAVLFGAVPFSLSSCSHGDEANGDGAEALSTEYEYQIYCVNDDGTGLDSWGYNINEEYNLPLDKVVDKVFRAFVGEEYSEYYISAMPDSIKKVECIVDKNIVKVNLDKYYDKLDSLSKLYLRAALAMTMTQIEGIDYVYVTVNGQPLTDSTGKVFGYLNARNFVLYEQECIEPENESKMIIYVPNETGDALVAETVIQSVETGENPAVHILKLLRSRLEKSGKSVITDDTVVDNVFIKDKICYINFDESINDNKFIGIDADIILYSIVNSLIELGNVSGVQITINGGTDILFRDEINLGQIFRLNLNYLEKKK